MQPLLEEHLRVRVTPVTREDGTETNTYNIHAITSSESSDTSSSSSQNSSSNDLDNNNDNVDEPEPEPPEPSEPEIGVALLFTTDNASNTSNAQETAPSQTERARPGPWASQYLTHQNPNTSNPYSRSSEILTLSSDDDDDSSSSTSTSSSDEEMQERELTPTWLWNWASACVWNWIPINRTNLIFWILKNLCAQMCSEVNLEFITIDQSESSEFL